MCFKSQDRFRSNREWKCLIGPFSQNPQLYRAQSFRPQAGGSAQALSRVASPSPRDELSGSRLKVPQDWGKHPLSVFSISLFHVFVVLHTFLKPKFRGTFGNQKLWVAISWGFIADGAPVLGILFWSSLPRTLSTARVARGRHPSVETLFA